MLKNRCYIILLLIQIVLYTSSFAQVKQSPIKIFGYFQNSLQYWTTFEDRPEQLSFSAQQLNIFFQKNFNANWTALINVEFLNNFSSRKQWGSFSLEEVWIKYRASRKFNLKLGLLTPTFNNLNEIKNRTPLLPYIIRPVAYETSFNEFLAIELFTPLQAFIQVYGFFPMDELKIDYAFYTGNSPNLNGNPNSGQTGIDTTMSMLVGGRLGIRFGKLKFGISGTYDKDNIFKSLAADNQITNTDFSEIPKTRLGIDLSYDFDKFSFEGELINVDMETDRKGIKADLDFYYATLGYHFTEKLFVYGSYWFLESNLEFLINDFEEKEGEDIHVISLGASYTITDQISLKAQFARVMNEEEETQIKENKIRTEDEQFNIATVAISVIF